MYKICLTVLFSFGVLYQSVAQKKRSTIPNTNAVSQRIFIGNKLFKTLDPEAYKIFKDSIFTQTKDSLSRIGKRTVVLVQTITPNTAEAWIPSQYVYTNAKGNLLIELPNTQSKRYSLFIYDGPLLLFNMTNLQEDKWIVEKGNFYHSGWYNFELYCNGELLERNKFLLQ
jgi:hypothetical protein